MSLLILTVLVVSAQPATIDVYKDSIIGAISPDLFGSGDEINEDYSQGAIDSLVSFIGVPLLRMGGISVEYYDWEANDYDGVWYIDFVDTFIIAETLHFGIDSFLRFSERVGVEPILTVNFQLNDPGKAARMVEYCNGDTTTPMGQIRAQRGHPQPYNVTCWCIGNEPDISGSQFNFGPYVWTFYRHFGIPFASWSWQDSSFVDPSSFGVLVDVYMDSMRAHSPVPLEIGGISLAADLSWIQPVIGANNDEIDWMDIHYYPNFSVTADSNLYREWLASIDTGSVFRPPVEDWYQQVCDSVAQYSGGHDIPVYVYEYNGGIILAGDPLWWNYLDALFVADVLGHFTRAGVPRAAVYSIYEGEPDEGTFPLFGIIRGDTLSMRATAWVLKLYLDNFGGTLIKTTSDAVQDGGGLEAYGSVMNNDTLSLIVINKNLDSAYTATVNIHGFISNDTMEVWDITNDTILAAPWNGTKGIVYRGKRSGDSTSFVYTFPRASVTSVWMYSKDAGVHEKTITTPERIFLSVSPNPFTQKAEIRWQIADGRLPITDNNLQLRIYDMGGRLVRQFLLPTSYYLVPAVVKWDGTDDSGKKVCPGVYFCQLKAGGVALQTKKLLFVK